MWLNVHPDTCRKKSLHDWFVYKKITLKVSLLVAVWLHVKNILNNPPQPFYNQLLQHLKRNIFAGMTYLSSNKETLLGWWPSYLVIKILSYLPSHIFDIYSDILHGYLLFKCLADKLSPHSAQSNGPVTAQGWWWPWPSPWWGSHSSLLIQQSHWACQYETLSPPHWGHGRLSLPL